MKNYITVDGGTTNTRVSIVSDFKVLDTLKFGMGAKASGDDISSYKEMLRDKISEILKRNGCKEESIIRILASGMITSEMGIYPLEHLTAPVGIEELYNNCAQVQLPEISTIPFVFVRGVKTACESLESADMMRGEEAELIGIMKDSDRCYYMLMGSHTKIIKTDKNGRITDFHTMLTGEMAECIAKNTILKNCVFLENEPDKAYLKKGYEYCREWGIGKALFKVRILKNLFDGNDAAVYSFYMGAVLCGEAEFMRRENPEKIIIGGNKKLKDLIYILLGEYLDCEIIKLTDEEVNSSVPVGLVKIYENHS